MSAKPTDAERALAAYLCGQMEPMGSAKTHALVAQALADQRAKYETLTEPGDPDARMDAYYYGFTRTGVGIVDDILSAVAQAGKSYHGTDMWAEEDEWTKPSHEARIQAAADAAAERIRQVSA